MLTLSTDSEEAMQHFRMGMNDLNNVFISRAAEHFAAALDADPDLAIAKVMHSWLAPGLSGDEARQRVDGALGEVAMASTPELLFASAVRRLMDGDQDGARALFAATAGLAPDDKHVAFRHIALVEIGNPQKRIAALVDFTERFPDVAAAYNTLAYAQWFEGDKAGALRNVAKYAELLPDHPNSHDSVAEIMQFNGMYAQAIKHYEKAISLDEDYFAGYTGLAEARILGGDLKGARAALDEARSHAASDQQRTNISRFEANLYFLSGDGKAGLRTLKQAAGALEEAGATGGAVQAHQVLAVAEALFGAAENIPAHISRATELAEGAANNHAWAALAYGIAGNADAARRAALAFDEATDGNEFTRTLDGVVAVAARRYADAERILIESGLDDPWAMAFMARAQQEMGHTAEALALESEILADHGFTVVNFNYTLSRLMLVENGAGSIRASLGSK